MVNIFLRKFRAWFPDYKTVAPILATAFAVDEWRILSIVYELEGDLFYGRMYELEDDLFFDRYKKKLLKQTRLIKFESDPDPLITQLFVKQDDTSECPICYEILTLPLQTNCKHKFCARCLFTVLDCPPFDCPMCRSKVMSIKPAYKPNEISFDFEMKSIPDDIKQSMILCSANIKFYNRKFEKKENSSENHNKRCEFMGRMLKWTMGLGFAIFCTTIFILRYTEPSRLYYVKLNQLQVEHGFSLSNQNWSFWISSLQIFTTVVAFLEILCLVILYAALIDACMRLDKKRKPQQIENPEFVTAIIILFLCVCFCCLICYYIFNFGSFYSFWIAPFIIRAIWNSI